MKLHLLLLVASQGADVATSHACSSVAGLYEANPIVAYILGGGGFVTLTIVKLILWPLAVVGTLTLLGKWKRLSDPKLFKLLCWTVTATATLIFLSAAISNLSLLK